MSPSLTFGHAASPRSLRRVCLLLLASSILILPPGPELNAQALRQRSLSPTDESSLHEALDAYDRGDAAHAEPLLLVLVKRYPRNYEANEALGSLYAEAADLTRALPYLQQAAKLAPRQAIAHANLGAAYLKLNKTTSATTELEAAARLDPTNASTQSALGQSLMIQGDSVRAAHAFAIASSIRPDQWDLRYNWALALFNSGSLPQAEAVLKAIPTQAVTDQTASLAGDIHEKLGNYKQAILDYQAAAKLNPSDPNLYALTAELLRHWTWAEAIQIARYGEKLYPASLHFHVAEGIALYADSQYPAAASAFSSLLAADPDNPLYADLLGRSCTLLSEDATSVCNGLDAFAKSHPQNAQAATYAATALLHRPQGQQDTPRAEAFLHQALAADPKLADAWFQMGVLDQMRLDWKQSASMLEHAIALRPAFPEAHYRLSRAYAHLGQRDEAQREIALQQKYSQQEKDSLNTRMQEVVKFVLKPS